MDLSKEGACRFAWGMTTGCVGSGGFHEAAEHMVGWKNDQKVNPKNLVYLVAAAC